MNVRTNHCNGHGGVSPPESQTPRHALFLVMQIPTKANNSHDITPPLSVLQSFVRHTCAYLCMRVCTHMDVCAIAHARTHNHLRRSMAGGNDRAPCSNDKVRKDQDTAVLSGGTS